MEKLHTIPEKPGVYLMYDKSNTIIYIGKAKILKRRVKSYFNKKPDTAKLRVMVPQIVDLEYFFGGDIYNYRFYTTL